MKQLAQNIWLLLLLVLVGSGCGYQYSTPSSSISSPAPLLSNTPLATSTPKSIHSDNPAPSPTFPPFPPTFTPPPLPTAAPGDALVYFYHLLDPHNCVLPCVFGITLGKTSLQDAKRVWAPLGTFYLEGKTDYAREGYLEREVKSSDIKVFFSLHYLSPVNSSAVQELEISAATLPNLREVWQHWQHLSITGVGKYWGTPTQVYLSLDFQWEGVFIALAYNGDINRILLYGGDIKPVGEKNARICVDSAHFSLDAWSAIYGSSTATQELEENWAAPTLTKTSAEALGLAPKAFMQYIHEHQSAEGTICFITPISIWPPPYKPEP